MSTTKKIIAFANTAQTAPDPVSANDKLRFRDLTFQPNLREKTIKWDTGTNWIRILPPIQGSSYQWMMRIETLQAPDGQGERLPTFCHPKSFTRGAVSPFDEAYAWFKKEAKEQLYNREKNPNGLKLNTKSQGVAWVIHTGKEPGEKLGIFCASLYDGSWGGGPGLAYKIWMEANQVDTEPNSPTFEKKVHDDITAPQSGNLVLIEKHKPESGDRYASYLVRIGKTAAPIEGYTDSLTDAEHDILVPLENAFYRPSEEEQHQILREYIGTRNYRMIFGEGEATGLQFERTTMLEKAEPEPTPVKDPEPQVKTPVETPAPAPEPPKEPEAKKPSEPQSSNKTYSIREVSSMMGTKEGVLELLKHFDSLQTGHRSVLLEVAKDMGIDTSSVSK